MDRKVKFIIEHLTESINLKQKIVNNPVVLKTISEIAHLQEQVLCGGGKLIFAGNGGSAADAQHLSAEYISKLKQDRHPLAAISLATDKLVESIIISNCG